MRSVIAAVRLWTLAAPAQQAGQNAPSADNGAFKMAVSTQLVVETVMVKDKRGNNIEGLSAKDFSVIEDGVPQTVRFCEYQHLPETPSAEPTAQSEHENIKIYDRLAKTRIAPEMPARFTGTNSRSTRTPRNSRKLAASILSESGSEMIQPYARSVRRAPRQSTSERRAMMYFQSFQIYERSSVSKQGLKMAGRTQ
jgi:hypothetical protein